MVLVVSSVALAFFRDADSKLRFRVFLLIFAGAAAFAAAVLTQRPTQTPTTAPQPAPSPTPSAPTSTPTPTPSPACRTEANGLDHWGKVETVSADSGWRGGGSSPAKYCNGEFTARRSALDDAGTIDLVNTSEDSKDESPPFNVRRYRYTCAFTQRSEPVYKSAPNPSCAAPK